MESCSIQRRVALIIIVILYLVLNGNGSAADDEMELQKKLPLAYYQALGTKPTILPNIWNSYSIRYARHSDNVTTIIYSGPYKQGWVGIGVSKTGGMIGSSAMVGWTSEGGKNMIKQYSLQGYSPTKVIANQGELRLTTVPPAAAIIKGNLYMAFQLKFPNDDIKHKIIFTSSPDSPTGDVLTMHRAAAMKEIDFSKGDVDSSASTRKAAHGAIAFLAWQVLIPIGILFPIYFKHLDPQWFYLHMSVQITGYVMAFITVLLGLRVSSDLHINWVLHKFIGITVLFMATLQVLAIWARPTKDSPSRNCWNLYHHGVGYTAALLALLNFLMGLLHAGFALKAVYVVWFIGLNVFVFFVVPRITKRGVVETNQPPVFTPTS